MKIREIVPSDIEWIEAIVTTHFGSPEVVSRGVLHDARKLPGLVAEVESEPVGLLQYRWKGTQGEIVVLVSMLVRQGIGTMLVEAAKAKARKAGCERLWLITTNNNSVAQQFYRAIGWRQVATHEGAVRESRKLKPEIPELDRDGTPIVDEIEFEWRLSGG